MTEGLVERLKRAADVCEFRTPFVATPLANGDILREAASRIIALEAERDHVAEQIGYTGTWFDRWQVAEARTKALQAQNTEYEEALRPFAAAWRKLRDPLPQRPFTISIDANACAAAARALLPQGEEK